MKLISILSASLLVVGSVAMARTTFNHYEYSVRISASSQGCQAEANALAKAFVTFDSQLQNVTGTCLGTSTLKEDGKSYSLDSLSVQYDSAKDQATEPFHVVLDTNPLSGSLYSVYPKFQDCFADIESQKAVFQTATGMTAIAVSCEAISAAPDLGYRMIISGLGNSDVSIFQFTNNAHNSVQTDATWMNLISKSLTQKGALIAKQIQESYFYYATSPISLSSQTLITTQAVSECEEQQLRAASLLKKLGANTVVITCHTTDNNTTLDIIDDLYMGASSDYGTGSPVFYDFNSCMTALQQLDKQDALHGDNTSVHFCAVSDMDASEYVIETFRNRE